MKLKLCKIIDREKTIDCKMSRLWRINRIEKIVEIEAEVFNPIRDKVHTLVGNNATVTIAVNKSIGLDMIKRNVENNVHGKRLSGKLKGVMTAMRFSKVSVVLYCRCHI